MLENIQDFINIILHIDKSLAYVLQHYNSWVYAILFLIIFAETGLVVLPFLPGDSLLFLIGAFCANDSMNLFISFIGLIISAIIGNTCNYYAGYWFYSKVEKSHILNKLIDKNYILKTEKFFETHGKKTIVLARFLPVIRTFAPFIAGASKMNDKVFQIYNFIGAILWVSSFLMLGYFFGNIEIIKQNLNTIVLIGFACAIIPIILMAILNKFKKSK